MDKVVVLGLGVVFAILIILIGVISLMKVVFSGFGQGKKKTEPVIESVEPTKVNDCQASNDEVVAAISAAIAMMWNTSIHNVVVKSVRRIPNSASAWNKAGRNETL
jgi:sodium pump decarboxylase gamma subunit